MHNNGTNRLILPDSHRLLPNITQPASGIRSIVVVPEGLQMLCFWGEEVRALTLAPQQATQLGVHLISISAIAGNIAQMAAQAKPTETIDEERDRLIADAEAAKAEPKLSAD